ncbi:MAG TPA: STM3941 family protein [Rhizomicrobium sp.]|jgi:hypothetical protein|nr:STM3941 family protein [Rhizomicrobium sp.]
MSDAGTFAARYVSWKLLLLFAGCMVFVALGLWLIFGPTLHYLIGFLCVLLFGAYAIAWFARLFDRRKILVIDTSGLVDRRIVDRAIPWDAIIDIRIWKQYGQRSLIFSLNRPVGDFCDNWFNWIMLKLNGIFFGGNVIYMNASGLDIGFDDLLREIKFHIPSRLTAMLDGDKI